MKEIHWILIRGLVRETRHWGEFPNILSKHFAEVTTLELPGVGIRKNELSPLKIEEYVEDLRKQFLEINSDAPKGLCAISMGGMIAQSWLNTYPEDFKCSVIINSSGGRLSPLYHRLTPQALGLLTNLFFNHDPKTQVEGILNKTTNMIRIDKDLIAKWTNFEKEFPTSRKSFLRQIKAAASFNVPKSIGKPTLFVASLKDRFVSHHCTSDLARHYNCPVSLHPTAGHDLPLDDPLWLSQTIFDFVTNNETLAKV